MPNYKIAPSLLSADFARLGEDAKNVLTAGGDILHFDVMDQHFVPSLTVGPLVCKALRQYGILAPIDVHLMTRPVDNLITAFAEVGATSISFHPECSDHIDRSLELIRSSNCQAGLALNPATPLTVLDHILDKLDFILIMSVNPGFGGQSFISSSLDKIKKTHALIKASGKKIRLAVDGGINLTNIAAVASAGADTFIAGSAIFGTPDYQTTISNLRQALLKVSHA